MGLFQSVDPLTKTTGVEALYPPNIETIFDPKLADPKVFTLEMGKMWVYIMKLGGVKKDDSVIEVAPGMRPNIGIGLSLLGFKGTLYIVEPCAESLQAVSEQYRKLLPDAHIKPICCTLSEAKTLIDSKVAAIFSNHPMDDMLLAQLPVSSEKLDQFFVNNYVGPDPQRTIHLWDMLKENPAFFAECREKVVTEWSDAIKYFSPSTVGISQYRSYFFRSNGIITPDEEALEVLRRLAHNFTKIDRSMELVNSCLLEPERWLLLRHDT